MEASKNSILFIPLKIASSWCQQMGSSLHQLGECVLWDASAHGKHLSDSETSVQHVVSPTVHGSFPLRESIRFVANILCLLFFGKFPHSPEISPFGIIVWL